MQYCLIYCLLIGVVSANLTCKSTVDFVNVTCNCYGKTSAQIDINNSGIILNIYEGKFLIGYFAEGSCCINKHDTNCTLYISNSETIDGDIRCDNVSLTLFVYNVKENMNIYFVSPSGVSLVTANITLQDCDSYCNLSGCISSGRYNTSSSFNCVENTTLFVGGTMETISLLTCDVCSSWVGNAECWYALLVVDPFYIESDVADFECLLFGNSTAHTTTDVGYFLDDTEVNSAIVMSSSNNNKNIWCSMAVSSSTLKSNTSTLAVYWNHYSMIGVETSNNVVNTTNGVLLNAKQDVVMYCLIDANPEALCQFYINNTLVQQPSCVYHQRIESSSFVSCTGQNVAGNQTSSNLTITAVEQRIPEVESSHDTSEILKKGDDISLICDVPYSYELQTTCHWDTPAKQHDINEPSLILSNLTRFDLGYYTCHTNDLFESTQATVFLNVTYGPEIIVQNTTCKWSDVENGHCFVDFASNPLTQQYTLIDNEDDVPPNPNQTVAIAASVSAITVAVVIILVAIIVVRRKRQSKQPECDGPTHNANVYVNEEFDQDCNSFSTDGCTDEEIRSTHSVNSPIYGYDNEPLYDDVPIHDAMSAYETTIIGKSDAPYEDCNRLK